VIGCAESGTPPLFGPNPGLQGRHLVAFTSDRGQAPGMTDVYLYDLDAPGIITLPGLNRTASAERDPALSFDGNRVFFSAARGAPGDFDVYAFGVVDRVLLALPHVNSALAETDPAPAADGVHLAFVRQIGATRRIVMVGGWPPDSIEALPGLDSSSTYEDYQPSCDSTARRIAFTSTRNGNPDVFVWDRDSARVLALPDLLSPDDDFEPSITRDGRFVAFASNRPHANDGYRIHLYDLEARAFVALPGLRSTPPLASGADDVQPFLRYR
jgi:TolB protein